MPPRSKAWQKQSALFSEALDRISDLSSEPKRTQNREKTPLHRDIKTPFENEPPTDFSLPANRVWAERVITDGQKRPPDPLPLVIAGEVDRSFDEIAEGFDPSRPDRPLYTYALARWELVDAALTGAKTAESEWQATPVARRCELIMQVAEQLRCRRKRLTEVLIADVAKPLFEADRELSEAIDFAEYYLRCTQQFANMRDLNWQPRGTLLIASPWNFPVAIPTGGLCSALLTGNCVLFKPAKEAVLAGWELCQCFWEAGVPKSALQFINCDEATVGERLIQDDRLNGVILTGSSQTAERFLHLRPTLCLGAETGGKNSFIITELADRALAIRDLLHSAFGYNGQKCSAASLAIVEAGLYDDPSFRQALRDAAANLHVGPAWNLSSVITPLIAPPGKALQRALTSLEPKESWLLKPKQDLKHPNLWSPGIKWDVQKRSFTTQTELFGPVLSVMRAKNLDHALYLANATPYGLTAGLHSLDLREHKKWHHLIQAGNCYINRPITGAIVQRQPFGGCKKSSFGQGFKAGGPNYLLQWMVPEQRSIPKEKLPLGSLVNNLTRFLDKFDLSDDDLGIWYASISSYAFFWQQFKRGKDVAKLLGEDNILRYVPHKKMTLRVTPEDRAIDYLRAFAAALTCQLRLEVSWELPQKERPKQINWEAMLPIFRIVEEDRAGFISRIKLGKINRVRMLHTPEPSLFALCASKGCYLDHAAVVANGRIELLHYLRESFLSIRYHRYGNLGLREGELRRPLVS